MIPRYCYAFERTTGLRTTKKKRPALGTGRLLGRFRTDSSVAKIADCFEAFVNARDRGLPRSEAVRPPLFPKPGRREPSAPLLLDLRLGLVDGFRSAVLLRSTRGAGVPRPVPLRVPTSRDAQNGFPKEADRATLARMNKDRPSGGADRSLGACWLAVRDGAASARALEHGA